MSKLVPEGYITVHDALTHVGRGLFRDWTDEEHKARTGLLGEDEWLKLKDMAPPTGGGALGSGPTEKRARPRPATPTPHRTGDPSDPSYQAEYRARERYAAASHHLLVELEAGRLEAAILDPWTGRLHPAPASMWRRHDAGRMIEKVEAPLPHSRNTGPLLLREFGEASVPIKPMPEALIAKAIKLLKAKTATESMPRSQQAEFVRKYFSSFHVTERQIRKIFRSITVRLGRPTKSDKKV